MAIKIHKTIPGRSYLFRATGSATIKSTRDDTEFTLLTYSGDGSEQYFTAISPEVSVESSSKYLLQELFSTALTSSAGGGGSAYRQPQRIINIPDSYVDFKPEMLILEANCATVLNLNGGLRDFSLLDVMQSGVGVQEAELWVTIHDPTTLQWSDDLIWADDQIAPTTMELLYTYVFAVRKHSSGAGDKLIINLAYKVQTQST